MSSILWLAIFIGKLLEPMSPDESVSISNLSVACVYYPVQIYMEYRLYPALFLSGREMRAERDVLGL